MSQALLGWRSIVIVGFALLILSFIIHGLIFWNYLNAHPDVSSVQNEPTQTIDRNLLQSLITERQNLSVEDASDVVKDEAIQDPAAKK